MDSANEFIPSAGRVLEPRDRQAGNFNNHAFTGGRKSNKERRKRKNDRRNGSRDGVVVELSFKQDRRKGRDRRQIDGRSRYYERSGRGIIA